jgi:hypothetical protein
MKKRVKLIIFAISGISIIIIGIILYFLIFFNISDVNEEFISSLNIPDKNFKISAYYMTGGATSGTIIQLRKEYDPTLKKNHEIIENIRGFVDLKAIKLISDKEVEVIVGFKGKFAKEPDTLFIMIE